jgi:thymidylate synthase (FAD)
MPETSPAYHLDVLDKGYVELSDLSEDKLGSDVKTVNAARVSFAQRITELRARDAKLISYLGEHEHTSPFRHSALSFRVKLPLFVAAQWRTHMVASALQGEIHSFNETSARYVEMPEEFYVPHTWRSQHESSRQASGDAVDAMVARHTTRAYDHALAVCNTTYRGMLANKIAREQARMILPQGLYTSFMWTASLQAIANFIRLRDSEHAQWEIQQYAQAVRTITEDIFPNSLAALLAEKTVTQGQLDALPPEQMEYLARKFGYVKAES